MRNRQLMGMLAVLLAFPGLAYAEILSGTIQNVDLSGGKITLQRNDNQEAVTISVKDQNGLSALRLGSPAIVDADRGLFGGWEAQSIKVPESAQAQPIPVLAPESQPTA